MNTNDSNELFFKVYSLRVRIALRDKGFEPIFEEDNVYKPGLRCWAYLKTPEFDQTFSEIMKGGTT